MGPGLKPERQSKVPLQEPWPENLREFYERSLPKLRIRKIYLREWFWSCLEHIRKSFENYKNEAIQELVAEHQKEKSDWQAELSAAQNKLNSIADYYERLVADLTEENRRDPMTGLYNLSYLTKKAEVDLVASNLGRWGALAVVDIRDFKWYNDTEGLGHNIGDIVIKTVARVMVEKTRHEPGRPEDLCVRRSTAADEFIFLLWNLEDTQEGYDLAQRFKQAVREVDLSEEAGLEVAERIRSEHPIEVDVGVVFLRVGNRPDDISKRRQFAHKIVLNWLTEGDDVMYRAKKDQATQVYRIRTYIDGSGNLVEIEQELGGE